MRGDFANQPIDKIKAYNEAEVRILSAMMNVLRDSYAELGLRPLAWYGPGAVALAALQKYGVCPIKGKKGDITVPHHFGPFKLKNADGTPFKVNGKPLKKETWFALSADALKGGPQDWASTSFSGGDIDLLQAGTHCDPEEPIYQYDIASAYPAQCSQLPSMRGGTFIKHKRRSMTLAQLKAFVEPMNMLSQIEIEWNFDHLERELSTNELTTIFEDLERRGINSPEAKQKAFDEARGKKPPFYPFFYRVGDAEPEIAPDGTKEKPFMPGTILRPPAGHGRFFRSEVMAAIKWAEKFFDDHPKRDAMMTMHGAWEFEPATNEKPFAFNKELFNKRKQIVAETARNEKTWESGGRIGPKPYNVLEKTIKLVLNSIYGKMAQSLGTPGKIPLASNPIYAGAITAGTRAVLIEASVYNPYGVIFHATDGIQSKGPLGEARCRFETDCRAAKRGEAASCREEVCRGLKTCETKELGEWEHAQKLDVRQGAVFQSPGVYQYFDHKGKRKTRSRGFKLDFAGDNFYNEIVKGWANGVEKLDTPVHVFVTLGASIATKEKWEAGPIWKHTVRELNLNSHGSKRKPCCDKDRAKRLVPIEASDNFSSALSAPYHPEWLSDQRDELQECEWLTGDKFGGDDDCE